MNEIIKKNGITFGIVTGVISILITSSIYLIDLKLFTAWWLGILSIAIYLGIGIYLLTKTKKELGGVFPFKEAFTTYFISAVIGIAISVLFNIILFNFIDPEAKETLSDLSIEAAVNMMKKFNTPTSAIKEAVAKMEEQNQFDIVAQLKGSIFSIIFSAIFGLILAAIFKSKKQEQL
ncbi:DUF4199 domain-containing protein [Flavobacterium jejuense]|uniref:DUF4199 domain-containing protein n=1 Tax=Flavobacterium jejuense TaxID=1544455 RepID=A0ABX0IQM9_9FLAO|nr:DUF4199 domain-containing protein [Flavobacterium jejuense]NHN25197.1 DUF4199 domain-containing protein [Flavobacterium jejuense]